MLILTSHINLKATVHFKDSLQPVQMYLVLDILIASSVQHHQTWCDASIKDILLICTNILLQNYESSVLVIYFTDISHSLLLPNSIPGRECGWCHLSFFSLSMLIQKIWNGTVSTFSWMNLQNSVSLGTLNMFVSNTQQNHRWLGWDGSCFIPGAEFHNGCIGLDINMSSYQIIRNSKKNLKCQEFHNSKIT